MLSLCLKNLPFIRTVVFAVTTIITPFKTISNKTTTIIDTSYSFRNHYTIVWLLIGIFHKKIVFCLKLDCCKLHKVACCPTKCEVIMTSNYFQTVIADTMSQFSNIFHPKRNTIACALEYTFYTWLDEVNVRFIPRFECGKCSKISN